MKKNKSLIIELLIISLAILVLGGITLKQFALAGAKSRDQQRKSDLHEFSKIIELYFADYGKLPSEELINSLWGGSFVDGDYEYAKSVPAEKYGEKEYCYQVKDGSSFALSAELENKADADCKVEGNLCGQVNYCYTDIISINKSDL